MGNRWVQTELTQMGAHPQAKLPRGGNRLAAVSGRACVVILLGLGFFLAPALQGINLEADQSASGSPASRTADEAAAREALRLVGP